jgi:hypothetical protein
MSVQLTSKDGTIEESTSNGHWMAMTAFTNCLDHRIEKWNGCHDPVEYTPEQLIIMAERLEQIRSWPDILRELADKGGATLG